MSTAACQWINECQQTELVLEQRDFTAAILEAVSALVVVLDTLGRIVHFNRACEQTTGYTFAEVKGKYFWDLFLPPVGVPVEDCFQQLLSGQLPQYENDWGTHQGERRSIAWSNTALYNRAGAVEYVVSTGIDITERQQAEAAVRDDAERFSAIIATQNDVATAKLDSNVVMALIAESTQKLTRASGAIIELVEGDELVYRVARGTATPYVGLRIEIATSLSGHCVQTGEMMCCDDTETDPRVDLTICRQVGIRSMIVMPLSDRGKVLGVLKVHSRDARAFSDRDIDTLQLMTGLLAAAMSHASEFEAKQALVAECEVAYLASQDSEAQYRRIVETATEGIWSVDALGKTSFVNQRMADMLGYTVDEMNGQTFFTFIDLDRANTARLGRGHTGIKEQHDCKFRRKDGTDLWAIVSTNPLTDREGRFIGALSMVTDITERKRTEEALIESQTRLKLLNSISTGSMSGMSVEQIIERTVKQIGESFNTLRVAYSTIDNRGNLTVIHSIEPQGMPPLRGFTIDLTAALEYLNPLCVSEIVVVENVNRDSRLVPLAEAIEACGTQALLNVPFQHPDNSVSLLCLESSSFRKWSEHEIATLTGIAQYLSILVKDAHAQQERKRVEEEQQKLASLVENSPDFIGIATLEGQAIFVNEAGRELVGLEGIAEVKQAKVSEYFIPEDLDYFQRHILPDVMEHGRWEGEFRFRHFKTGAPIPVYYNFFSIKDRETGQPIAVATVSRDITEHKRTEAALRESEERFKTFMNNSPAMAFIKDEAGRFVYINEPFERLFDVKLANLQGKTDFDWLPEATAKQVRENDIAVLSTGKTTEVLEMVPTPDGCPHYWLVFKFPISDVSGRRLLGGVAVDITDRQQAEEVILASLQEKEVLLKEVHHRVKNNLQIIDSLFRHQCRHTQNRQTIEILKECQNRVNSMALLHEKLYQSKDLSKINLAGYLRSLVANLCDSYNLNTSITALKLDVDDIFLDIETALPCGLIVNELVSNSLKYAFPASKSGEIYINFHAVNTCEFVLSVKDNGIGLPTDFDLHKLQLLGLKLVKSLVRQLGGAIKINCSSGTEFKINF